MKKLAYILAGAVFLSSLSIIGCGKKDEDITVYMPDGAPALALAKLMHEDTERDGVSYRVVSPSLIKSKVTDTSMDENADLCVLPLTAATKLLGSGEDYQLLGAVTHGNLYLVSNENVSYTSENISALSDKTVGVIQLGEVPGLIVKTVLNKHGLDSAVNLQAITGAQDVGALTGVNTFVLAEPAASAQAGKGYSIVGDLQELYGGENGYPQAVLVAKRRFVETRSAWVQSFVGDLVSGSEWLSQADGQTIVSAVTAHLEDAAYQTTLKPALLTSAVIGRCGVRFAQAMDCKEEIISFLTSAAEVNANMAVLPSTDFYCELDFES